MNSEKFAKSEKDGESGYVDREEKVFIPKKSVPILIKEITHGSQIMLGHSKQEEYLALCQVRMKRHLKDADMSEKNPHYKPIFLKYVSTEFLKRFSNSTMGMTIIYADLVGSTLLSMHLHPEKLSQLVRMFSNEISSIISTHEGYVLKYVGDAVIGYFPHDEKMEHSCTFGNSIDCALNILNFLEHVINKVLVKEGYEPLKMRIGMEFGYNKILQVGGYADIIGHTMNMGAKVTTLSKPNGICVGGELYSKLDETQKSKFNEIKLDEEIWKYKNSQGDVYRAYEYDARNY